jgi:hypothetical protein
LAAFWLPDSRSARRMDLPPVEGVLGLEEKCMFDAESLSFKQRRPRDVGGVKQTKQRRDPQMSEQGLGFASTEDNQQ